VADARVVDRTFCDERNKAVTERMDLCIRTVNIRLESMDRALDLKTGELDKRLEGLNNLRAEVTKDRELFLRKETYDYKIGIYDKWVTETSDRVVRMETRYEGRITTATVLAIFSMLIAVLSVVLSWMHK
jgi:hypothetical protein